MSSHRPVAPQSRDREARPQRSNRLLDAWHKSSRKSTESPTGRPSLRPRFFATKSNSGDSGGMRKGRVGAKAKQDVLCDISILCPPPLTPVSSFGSERTGPSSARASPRRPDNDPSSREMQAAEMAQALFFWNHPSWPSRVTTADSESPTTILVEEELPPDYVQSQEEARRRSWPGSHPYDYWSSWSASQGHR